MDMLTSREKPIDVFISYRRDKGFYAARLVRDYLESNGLNVFMDLSEIHKGYFDVQILDAIERCKNFLLILSPGAIGRCVDGEDWLRREIVAATKAGKNIIPVWLKDFVWPKELNQQLPQEVSGLENQDGVIESQSYFDSMLLRIVERLDGIERRQHALQIVQNHSPAATTERYFREHMVDLELVQSVDMAFHAGSLWFSSVNQFRILSELLEAGANIRVLLNTPAVSEEIGRHMRMKGMRYTSFQTTVGDWYGLKTAYPGQIELRLSANVLLRRYYSFHMKDQQLDTVNVKHYMYGNPDVSKNYQSIFDDRSVFFDMYRNEFEYIWERADEYSGEN